MEPAAFLDALDRFLGTLPPGPQYATEVRNPAILGSRYLNILRTHNVSHVDNHWTAMPPLSEQHRLLDQTFTAPFVVFRLFTPLGLAYEKAVERYKPYDRIVQAQPRMRHEIGHDLAGSAISGPRQICLRPGQQSLRRIQPTYHPRLSRVFWLRTLQTRGKVASPRRKRSRPVEVCRVATAALP